MGNLNYEECCKYADALPGTEHTHLRSLEELWDSDDCIVCDYGKTNPETGVLLSVKRDDKDNKLKLYYSRKKLAHTLIIGSSGSGKSQGIGMNTLENADGRVSYIFADPKGEYYKATYSRLVDVYGKDNVNTINFMQPSLTDYHVNYLHVLAKEWLRIHNSKRNNDEKRALKEKIVNNILKYMDVLFLEESQKDPSWERVAKKFITAMVLGLFEDLTLSKEEEKKTKRCRTTPQMINFANVCKIFHSFEWASRRFTDYGFLTGRDRNSLAYKYSSAIICNADTTRANYLGFVDSYLNQLNDPRIEAISMYNDFDIEALSKTPQVIFFIYDISDEPQREFVNKVMAQNLNFLLESTHKNVKALDVPVIFYCDEFPTLKSNSVYPNVLATGRSSGIFLHMVVQSLSQLEARYPNEHKAMIENCDYCVFVGTNDEATAKKFSEELGKTTIPDPVAFLNGSFSAATVSVVSQDYLMHRMENGEVFVKVHRKQPIHGFFEFYYKTPEYTKYPTVERKGNNSKSTIDCIYDAEWMHPTEDDDEDDFDDLF